ncbi:hypothetical protein MEA186_09325 [Mesorhizobium amorphae CCNWGS0123]|uniref:Uncharacterized protein n=1 Tax=Mesorhizobium amorphae CCNWGS0123 TaxID=1082933 RepID=G6Y7E9_9HYPH|nr:hypothetical protein MEA186_09325 [Mesorhizobium amorphae CCNWGS0123]
MLESVCRGRNQRKVAGSGFAVGSMRESSRAQAFSAAVALLII